MLSFLVFLFALPFSHFHLRICFFPCSCFCFSVRKLRRSGCCDVISPRLQFRVASHPARSQARERAKFREQESQRGWQTERKRARARERESARQQLPLSANCTRNDLSEFRVKTDLRARPKSEYAVS